MKLRLAQTLERVLCSVDSVYPSPAKRIGAARAAKLTLVVFGLLKQGQHGMEVSAVVVGPVSADSDHAINSAPHPALCFVGSNGAEASGYHF